MICMCHRVHRVGCCIGWSEYRTMSISINNTMMPSLLATEVNISLGQCIEMCQSFLVEIVKHFCTSKELPYPPPGMTNDLLGSISYITDPSRFDDVLSVFIKEQAKDMKNFLKTWLFQMRSVRNAWAHWDSSNLNHLLAFRAFDTLHFVYVGFDGHKDFPLYRRIQTYRLYLMNHVLREIQVPNP